jgi:thioredoxin-like negative regulator of GroEL
VCRAGDGAFLLASGDLTAAREQLTLVVETEPRMVGAAMDLATAWAAGGSRAEAARVLDSAIESQPAATGALAAHAQRLGLAKQRKDLP